MQAAFFAWRTALYGPWVSVRTAPGQPSSLEGEPVEASGLEARAQESSPDGLEPAQPVPAPESANRICNQLSSSQEPTC